jgi:hypothetical protein
MHAFRLEIEGRNDLENGSGLIELMNMLGESAALEREYAKSPEIVMKRFGLSREEKCALLSCDIDAIRDMTGHRIMSISNGTVKFYNPE